MKNQEEIKKIARQHLIENPFPHSDYEWTLNGNLIELGNEYYFEYSFRHKNDLPPDKWEMFGGAPGFCVNKISGKVRDIRWDEYQETIIKK